MEINMKNLSYKLVPLLALISASWASPLQGLDERFMTVSPDYVKLTSWKL